MSTQNVNIVFNVSGNAHNAFNAINNTISEINANVAGTINIFENWGGQLVVLQQATQLLGALKDGLDNTFAAGIALNSSLADLSAISGETGESLKMIERYARESAKTFGGSAAQSVESYKLLLSQLSPELAKQPAALKAMGDNIAILSKTMGGDTTAAAEVLTTAMNQYGISLNNPMEASRQMAEMMNIMAAAGKEGSAELPTIKVALEQCGMAAKAANISFAETNAAIQVLDKAGKKGSEGGVALRNAISIMAQGRFIPKDVSEELQAAGIDVETLGDNSIKLSDRLRMLRPVMQDAALFGKMFGRENVNAAMALVQGADEIDRYTSAIVGTNTAYEQSQTIMDSYAERQSRIQTKFDDIRISLFNVTGDVGIWMQTIAGAIVPLAQIYPLLMSIGKGIVSITSNWGKMVKFIRVGIVNIVLNMNILKYSIQSAGGMFKYLQKTAITACNAIKVAIKNIPVIGWVIGIATVVIGAITICWKKFAGFRAFIITMWDTIKQFGSILKDYVIDRIHGIIEGLGTAGKAIAKLFKGDFNGAWEAAKSSVAKISGREARVNAFGAVKETVGGFKLTYSDNLAAERAKEEQKKQTEDPMADFAMPDLTGIGGNIPLDAGGTGGTGAGTALDGIGTTARSENAGKIRNINVTIDKVVEQFTVQTTNLKEDAHRIKDMVAEVLVSAINDINLAV